MPRKRSFFFARAVVVVTAFVVAASFTAETAGAAKQRQEPDKPPVSLESRDADAAKKNGEMPAERSGRWRIRNGVDAEAKRIAKKPVRTTFAALGALHRPAGTIPKDKRVHGPETTLWTVDARLIAYDLRKDGDYHLVFKDKAGRTLVAELPDPEEIAASPFAREIGAARRAFTKRFSEEDEAEKGEAEKKDGKVHAVAATPLRITGIGYFTRLQKPGLPNGLQLHPITGVSFR